MLLIYKKLIFFLCIVLNLDKTNYQKMEYLNKSEKNNNFQVTNQKTKEKTKENLSAEDTEVEKEVHDFLFKEMLKHHNKFIESRNNYTDFLAKDKYKKFLIKILIEPSYKNLINKFFEMKIESVYVHAQSDLSGLHDKNRHNSSINIFFTNKEQSDVEIYYCSFVTKEGDVNEKLKIYYLNENSKIDWQITGDNDPLYSFMKDLLEDLKYYYIT